MKMTMRLLTLAVPAVAAVVVAASGEAGATVFQMTDYSIAPAFVSTAIPPNTLLLFDNSASMYDLQYSTSRGQCLDITSPNRSTYTACTADNQCTAVGTDVVRCVKQFCFGSDFDKDNRHCSVTTGTACSANSDCPSTAGQPAETCVSNYSGYFDPLKFYTSAGVSYDSDTNTANASYPSYSLFSEYTGTFPPSTIAGKTYQTSYMSVRVDQPAAGSVEFVARGDFLNWLAASKMDVEKQILTGGKWLQSYCSNDPSKYCTSSSDCGGQSCTTPTTPTLVGETRGCAGQRYVKEVVSADWTVLPTGNPAPTVTFGIRGDISSDVKLPATGGITRIDIFSGNYDNATCQAAINEWTLNGSQGQAKILTSACLTMNSNGDPGWNHAVQACWTCGTPCTADNIGNVNDVENACSHVYATQTPASLSATDPNYVCTWDSNLPTPPSYANAPGTINGVSGAYIGACWDTNSNSWKGNRGNGNGSTDTCVQYELAAYCNGLKIGQVVDPSSSNMDTAATGNIPANMVNSGVMGQLGNPIRTYHLRVPVATEPKGVLQDYKDRMRFGAMTFNNVGASSECTTLQTNTGIQYACGTSADKDGGKVVWYIGDPGRCSNNSSTSCTVNADCGTGTCISVGNHTGGLVKSLDDVKATTWTPFAEAYYDAIAYYVNGVSSSIYTIPATSQAIQAPINSTDFAVGKNPIQFACQQNFTVLITDGSSTTDANATVVSKVKTASNLFRDPTTATSPETGATATTLGSNSVDVCGNYLGTPYLHDLTYYAHHRNIFEPTTSLDCTASGSACKNSQTITTFVVYNGTTTSSGLTGVCDPLTQMTKAASNGGTSIRTATDPATLERQLRQTFDDISAKAASGTAASILNNSEGSGANLLQAVFYPKRQFPSGGVDGAITWIGEMQDLWYYLDPYMQNSTIREDTNYTSGAHTLDLTTDYVLHFGMQTTNATSKVMVDRWQDTNGDGAEDVYVDTVDPDSLQSLWRAGKLLWNRDLSSEPRHIYTVLSSSLVPFTTLSTVTGRFDTNNASNRTLLQAGSPSEANQIIDYINGVDNTTYRSRTVATTTSGLQKVWKLGDIVSSTPKLVSSVNLNSYAVAPPGGYNDTSYSKFVASTDYASRGVAFVGSNDGMLHAFNLGNLVEIQSTYQKASLSNNISGSYLGQELWSFIPKNTLPYLKYYGDPDYTHLYYVDGPTVVVDASVNPVSSDAVKFPGCAANAYWNCERRTVYQSGTTLDTGNTSWRTILVGGMGLGGASRDNTDSCDPATQCVKNPISGLGYSSYFALDVTDPTSPQFLWEFSGDPANSHYLGYATTGPVIVRVGDKAKNGRWFAVFASGPTGPIDTTFHQFKGTSNQNLKIFVVDLLTGTLAKVINTGITNAFASSLSNTAIDTDRWNPSSNGFYNDDAVYIGYTQLDSTAGTWTKGGVVRLSTNENPQPGTSPDWVANTVITGVGPVTTAVTKLQDRKHSSLWLFFGTGRYFYRTPTEVDDQSSQRTLYGIKDPCYYTTTYPVQDLDPACSSTVSASSLVDQSGSIQSVSSSDTGWFINLDTPVTGDTYFAERVITDPVALPNGTVFFTTFRPTLDVCAFGGNSFVWAVKYDTGGAPLGSAMQGKTLIQVSTGAFQEISMASGFTAKSNRRTTNPITGVPPKAQGMTLISNPKPVKKLLHIQER